MKRRAFIRRLAAGVLCSGMLVDALAKTGSRYAACEGMFEWQTTKIPSTPMTAADLNEAMKVIFSDAIYDSIPSDSELMDLFEKERDGFEPEEGHYIYLNNTFGLPIVRS